MNRILTALALFFAASLTAGRAGTILYTQTATSLGEAYTTWESESVDGDVNARTYDNFILSSSADVGAVTWEGIYLNQQDAGANPVAADSSAFEISFWSDNNGSPGAELASSTVQFAATNATKLGTVSFALATNETATIPVYSYSAQLPIAFAATAGTKYWISILSDSPALQPAWGWYSGSGGDGNSVQDFDNSRIIRQYDRAFTLESAPLPVVTVEATTPDARFGANGAGVFTFKLSEAQATPTVIHFALKGTALDGRDYRLLTDTVKIKPGATSAVVRVVPKETAKPGKSQTVKLLLRLGTEYVVGKSDIAVVTILDPPK